jgi:hypothetical protein
MSFYVGFDAGDMAAGLWASHEAPGAGGNTTGNTDPKSGKTADAE